jgi:hypothetical protein
MKDYEPIPNSDGMSVLRDVNFLRGTEPFNVILRKITEDFWRKVIEATEHSRVCALGTPGIGKTFTTCILIRLLLLDNKTVVYRHRTLENDGTIYVFTPSTDSAGTTTYNVGIQMESEFNKKDTLNESTYYIVDPGRTK